MIVRKPIAFLFALGALRGPEMQIADAATPAPAWDIQSISAPTNFLPGEASGEDRYQVFLTNSGSKPRTDQSPITITDTLPKRLGVKSLAN